MSKPPTLMAAPGDTLTAIMLLLVKRFGKVKITKAELEEMLNSGGTLDVQTLEDDGGMILKYVPADLGGRKDN